MPTLLGEHAGQCGHQALEPFLADGMSTLTAGAWRCCERRDPLELLQTTEFGGMVVEALEEVDEVLVQRSKRFGSGIDQVRMHAVAGGKEAVLRQHFVGTDEFL